MGALIALLLLNYWFMTTSNETVAGIMEIVVLPADFKSLLLTMSIMNLAACLVWEWGVVNVLTAIKRKQNLQKALEEKRF